MSLAQQIQHIQQQIAQACQTRPDSYRLQPEVRLIAVSKTQPAEAIRSAYQAGLREFGENYVQEAVSKQQALTDLAITWHFIGPIQSNKTHTIASHFDWVHGVDREKIAQRLNQARSEIGRPLDICLQVNISDETSKSGVSVPDLPALLQACLALPYLRVRGLMTIPDPRLHQDQLSQQFLQMHQLLGQCNHDYQANMASPMDTLSMGMSNDYTLAIHCGATLVRIGSAIFGQRPPAQAPSSHFAGNPI